MLHVRLPDFPAVDELLHAPEKDHFILNWYSDEFWQDVGIEYEDDREVMTVNRYRIWAYIGKPEDPIITVEIQCANTAKDIKRAYNQAVVDLKKKYKDWVYKNILTE